MCCKCRREGGCLLIMSNQLRGVASAALFFLLFASPAAGQTGTFTPTQTPTATPTATVTITATRTNTATVTLTPTKTATPLKTSTAANTSTPVPTTTTVPTVFGPSSTATASPTPGSGISTGSDAGCVVLSNTPQAIGTGSHRKSFHFWAVGGDAYCGYNSSTLSRTPGVGTGADYPDGSGEQRCDCQDNVLYCVGDASAKVCYSECVEATTTITPTPTITSTATRTATFATPTGTVANTATPADTATSVATSTSTRTPTWTTTPTGLATKTVTSAPTVGA